MRAMWESRAAREWSGQFWADFAKKAVSAVDGGVLIHGHSGLMVGILSAYRAALRVRCDPVDSVTLSFTKKPRTLGAL